MKQLKTLLALWLLICLSLPCAFAQDISTQGTEFWLSFMHNGFRDHTDGGWVINQVLISAKRSCTGTVSNPLTGWSENFAINANSITTIEIPEAQGYHNGNVYETITQKGIKVESSDTISVYCTNIAHVSFDASFVLPVESLGDEYIIQSHDQSTYGSMNSYVSNNETSAFIIVATEDNTVIDITPSCNTLGGHPSGETFSINMNAGETFHVRSVRTGSQRDLSGTKILAADCKRIAVFNGNTLTCIPVDQGNGYDHVFEQAMPIRSWGKNFVVTSSLNRNRDFVKITSSANDNVITKNGMPLTTLNAGQSHTFSMMETEGSCFIQAAYPCAVYLYNNSSYDQSPGGGLGDPSMVWIAPVEQKIDEVTFSTFDHANIGINVHCVNIIVNTSDIANVYFDNEPISPILFNRVNGNDNYSYTRKNISHGVHHISCPNGFNAHVYGFGQAKGYAYLVGSNTIDLSTNLTLNDEVIHSHDQYPYCVEQPITFSVEVNFPEYDLLWDFGDGTTSSQNPVTHTYHEKRVFHAALAITTDASGCTSSSSDTTKFSVDATQQYITYSDEICDDELYSGYGFQNVLIHNDTILGRLQDNPIHPECSDSVLLYVTTHPAYHIDINDSRCLSGGPSIYNEHGFYFEYDHPGTFVHTLESQTIHGCDSIITLTLEVGNYTIHDSEQIYKCYEDTPSFTWEANHVTYHEAGHYSDTLPDGDCYSVFNLDLHFMKIPEVNHNYQTACDSYDWYVDDVKVGTYMESTEEEYRVSMDPFPCEQVYKLHLNMHYSPTPRIAYAEDAFYQDGDTLAVVTNTEFFSFQYDFFIEDALNHKDDWGSGEWKISKDSWVIEPFTKQEEPDRYYCRVYVADRDDNPVVLKYIIYDSPCEPDTVTQRFYLKSSFLGLEDQGIGQADFDIAPNPNNGQMTLHFENLDGQVEIKVYDMKGVLIDRLEHYCHHDGDSMTYEMKQSTEGIYLFVCNHEGKVFSRKAIITK